MDVDRPVVADLVAEVATAVSRRAAEVSQDVCKLILREIPQLDDDKPVVALLASSVDSNVGTCLQILQHRIDLTAVRAPASAVEYARRLAQRGTPLTALLRAYRLGHTCFSDWLLRELAEHTDDPETITATVQSTARLVAGYIDQVSEEMVTAYTKERENWLRNCSAARAGRIRDLLSGQRIDVSATEATLGYRLRQHHLGVVCWTSNEAIAVDNITRLERAISHIAAQTAAGADPVFLPRDESSAWAWLPLGIRDRFDPAACDADAGIHVAFGDVVKGIAGFRLTHRQALAAQAVALAGGSPPRVVTYAEVAPVAMMLGIRATCCGPGCAARSGRWPPTTSTTPGCARPCWCSSTPAAATRPPPNGWCCTRTPSSTGSTRPRRASAARSATTATTSNWRSRPATGSARRCSSRTPDGTYPARPWSRARDRVPDLQHPPLERALPPGQHHPRLGPRDRADLGLVDAVGHFDRGDGIGPDGVLGRPQPQPEGLRALPGTARAVRR